MSRDEGAVWGEQQTARSVLSVRRRERPGKKQRIIPFRTGEAGDCSGIRPTWIFSARNAMNKKWKRAVMPLPEWLFIPFNFRVSGALFAQ
jgi:hypothetical protein